eukprot:4071902-Pleurochrysis_carterae.AAC.1
MVALLRICGLVASHAAVHGGGHDLGGVGRLLGLLLGQVCARSCELDQRVAVLRTERVELHLVLGPPSTVRLAHGAKPSQLGRARARHGRCGLGVVGLGVGLVRFDRGELGRVRWRTPFWLRGERRGGRRRRRRVTRRLSCDGGGAASRVDRERSVGSPWRGCHECVRGVRVSVSRRHE